MSPPADIVFPPDAMAEPAQSAAIPVDLLIGNYLNDYFRGAAQALAARRQEFRNERRALNFTFYQRCLPETLDLRPYAHIRPKGRWDWFVYTRATQSFWRSMQPMVHRVVGNALAKCGLLPTVRDPVLHFRCASAPINRKAMYHFPRYSFYLEALLQYERVHGRPLRKLHLVACVVDDLDDAKQVRDCTAYLEDLRRFLVDECGIAVRVHNCRRSMFHDFAIMAAAPFLISSGSTMSLMAAAAGGASAQTEGGSSGGGGGGLGRRRFAFPRVFNEEALASNGRATHQGGAGCVGCGGWMVGGHHTLCHCEVEDYADTNAVTRLLRTDTLPPSSTTSSSPVAADATSSSAITSTAASTSASTSPPSLAAASTPCPRCGSVHCGHFVLSACLIRYTSPSEPATPRAARAPRGASCAQIGARLMTQAECYRLAHAPVWREARRWIGASTNAAEHPGCVLWDDGGVEYNGHAEQAMGCNIKGVCLCVANGGASERYATAATDGGLGARGPRVIEVVGAGLASGNSHFEATTTILAEDDAV